MKTKIIIVLALASSFPAIAYCQKAATASDMTVLGLHVGDKFSLPECATDVSAFTPPAVICFVGMFVNKPNPTPVNDQHVLVRFPGAPTEMTVHVEGQIIDGNIEGLVIQTRGLSSQDSILAALKEKYGDPSTFQEENLQNGYGAVYQSHQASWIFGPLSAPFSVIFKGAVGKVDEGFIYIETNKEFEFQKALIEKLRKGVTGQL